MTNHFTVAKEEMTFYGQDCTSLQNMLAILIGPKADPSVTGQLASLGVNGLSVLSRVELMEYPSIGDIGASRILAAFGLANHIRKYQKEERFTVRSPEDAAQYFSDMEYLNQEFFDIIYLNTKNQVISRKNIFKGTLNASIVHPRDVLREGVRVNAASFIAAHNHPSNDPSPSREDIDVTKRLVEAGKNVGIEILDHLVIGGSGRFVSLKEKGYI
ncbi:DNA repair protein RadC [Sutcliffiella horikoshii]|uniref:JAB domain-containing protein n=1 Tax=Sutcliffiella horikoshii TaxID=79883 RepID=UPI00203B855B|nr:DNA repair protein RadC [Sutcliffiella horikoshii]MCM3619692.1 DNA repair protein RadC [Sutcliffiella horikoshii]